MVSKIPVTVVVPVKNEERNLSCCLGRLSRFQEVVVVDSNSVDRTRDVAESYGAVVVNFDWNGTYPKKRNWILGAYKFSTEWVLFLDADEYVDDDFCAAVEASISSGEHAGYWIEYNNYFGARRLRFGVPQRKLALFKRGHGLYERIDERSWSRLDMEIHEHPVIEGSVGTIPVKVDHRDYRGLDHFLERHLEYAKWEAHRTLDIQSRASADEPGRTVRQRVKYAHVKKWWFSWFYMIYTYFVRLGFLDGEAGFNYAVYKFWYFFTVRQKIRELAASPPRDQVRVG
jgi:glycosyltransferase involved in cell wall biosynthesis